MDIRNRKILILGGYGLVGMATIRKLVQEKPAEVIIGSLTEAEARTAVNELKKETFDVRFTPVWGNIFVRDSLKDLSRSETLNNPEYRTILTHDVMEGLDEDIMAHSTLNQIITRYRPHIIIDTVNSATSLAYQDIYHAYYMVQKEMEIARHTAELTPRFTGEVEKLLATLYIPQIIRHIQVLYTSMIANETQMYIKIGTSGTGGMGLNIPYTHSEEKPSRVLLSKSSLAGAHTLLLFLMGRTPDAPITKEIKPAAAIAWKKLGHGVIKKRGKAIELYDCSIANAETLDGVFHFEGDGRWENLDHSLEAAYIDTGENGLFSLGEFECITTVGQMEFVTPEEIATNVIMEIKGDSTGSDIINALDNAIMGPTYRAGYLRGYALQKMRELAAEHGTDSIAFELLGPPRLSKLLYEADLLRRVKGSIRAVAEGRPSEMVRELEEFIAGDSSVRSQIISIGIPILLSDGRRLIRGPQVEIPSSLGRKETEMGTKELDAWAEAGWVDLRESNILRWITRAQSIVAEVQAISSEDTSSQFHHSRDYWGVDDPLNIGKVAAWVFVNEDKGLRVKR